MTKVKSSTIHSLGYDAVEQTLDVLFNHGKCSGKGCPDCQHTGHSGQKYTYSDVPAEKYVAVRDGESVGKSFGEHIKNWKHPVTKEGYRFSKRPA